MNTKTPTKEEMLEVIYNKHIPREVVYNEKWEPIERFMIWNVLNILWTLNRSLSITRPVILEEWSDYTKPLDEQSIWVIEYFLELLERHSLSSTYIT